MCTETNGRLREVLTLLILSMFIERLEKVSELDLVKSAKNMALSRAPSLLVYLTRSKTPRDT